LHPAVKTAISGKAKTTILQPTTGTFFVFENMIPLFFGGLSSRLGLPQAPGLTFENNVWTTMKRDAGDPQTRGF
jgi:hypothetical protein